MTHFWTKKVHGFPVRTPICHTAPISRIYPPQTPKHPLLVWEWKGGCIVLLGDLQGQVLGGGMGDLGEGLGGNLWNPGFADPGLRNLWLWSLRTQRLKKINLGWNFQSWLKFSIPDLQNSPQKIGVGGWLAWKFQSRLKISIPEGDLEFFQSLGP